MHAYLLSIHKLSVALQTRGPGYDALPPQHPDLITPHSLPHCELPSTKRAASAANSVEAVQQDGDDEVVGSRRAFGGVVSLPAAYNARHQRTAQSRQRQDASTSTPMTSQPAPDLLEHRHSVVYDSESQRDINPNTQQQPEASLQPASQGSKHHKGGSPSNSQPPSQPQVMPSLSPECSAASEGPAAAGRVNEACQAAPDATQQATIQEVSTADTAHLPGCSPKALSQLERSVSGM